MCAGVRFGVAASDGECCAGLVESHVGDEPHASTGDAARHGDKLAGAMNGLTGTPVGQLTLSGCNLGAVAPFCAAPRGQCRPGWTGPNGTPTPAG